MEWCDRYELLFSRVDPASELFRLNMPGRPTAVDAELAAFIETALSYCRSCRRVIRRDYGKRHAAVELQGIA